MYATRGMWLRDFTRSATVIALAAARNADINAMKRTLNSSAVDQSSLPNGTWIINIDKPTGILKAAVAASTERLRNRTTAMSCASTATAALTANSLRPSTTIHELAAVTIQVSGFISG